MGNLKVRHQDPEALIEILIKRLEKDDVSLDSAKNGRRKGLSDFRVNQFSKRYVHYILARMTAYVESQIDQGDRFDAYTNWLPDSHDNPFEVEHLWPDDFDRFEGEFQSEEEFSQWRNHLGGLVLLPKSKNSSLNAKDYEKKRPFYRDENLLAASLTDQPYEHLPRFKVFRESTGLPFQSLPSMNKQDQLQRRELYGKLVQYIWHIDRLREL